jgi:hypothetical protein
MRTISPGAAQRCAPNGFSRVTVAFSSAFSISGSDAISPRPPSKPASRSR